MGWFDNHKRRCRNLLTLKWLRMISSAPTRLLMPDVVIIKTNGGNDAVRIGCVVPKAALNGGASSDSYLKGCPNHFLGPDQSICLNSLRGIEFGIQAKVFHIFIFRMLLGRSFESISISF